MFWTPDPSVHDNIRLTFYIISFISLLVKMVFLCKVFQSFSHEIMSSHIFLFSTLILKWKIFHLILIDYIVYCCFIVPIYFYHINLALKAVWKCVSLAHLQTSRVCFLFQVVAHNIKQNQAKNRHVTHTPIEVSLQQVSKWRVHLASTSIVQPRPANTLWLAQSNAFLVWR